MKNFENFEQLWRQQSIVARGEPRKIQAVQTGAARVVKSQGRLLRLGVALVLFFLVVGPLLMVVNFVHAGRAPSAVALTHFGVTYVFQIGMLIVLLRRLKAHRVLRARSAASVRDNLQASLELIESEMRDYRIGLRCFAALLLFDTLPVLNSYQQGYFDGTVAIRSLVAILLLGAGMFAVCVRHYRRVLHPQKQQLTELLGELDAE
jgi:hypothetical protein